MILNNATQAQKRGIGKGCRIMALNEKAEFRGEQCCAASTQLNSNQNDFNDNSDLCPEGYSYYYVEHLKLLGRTQGSVLVSEVYRPGLGWGFDDKHEISDRIIGYEPGEDLGWGIGNTEIMKEIRSISREEAMRLIQN